MARWMVGRGARHIVLVSRSGSQDVRVQHLLDEMHGRAVVKVIICDVADSEQVTRLVNTCAKTMPPICGVVHAAMALHVSSQIPNLLYCIKELNSPDSRTAYSRN